MALDKLKEIAHYRKSLDERNQPTISDYNIAELLREVKAKEGAEGQLGKYIHDDFLTNEKDEAERKTLLYYGLKMPYSITKNRIALITDKKDSDENYIVVIQEVDSAGRIDNRRVDVNKIITTFGKDYVEGQIKDAITENRILFADKKRSHMFSGGTSYQLARGRKTDFKDNINNFWAEVNYEEWKKNNK